MRDWMYIYSAIGTGALIAALVIAPNAWTLPKMLDGMPPDSELGRLARSVRLAAKLVFLVGGILLMTQFCQLAVILLFKPGTGLDTPDTRWISWLIDLACLAPLAIALVANLDFQRVEDEARVLKTSRGCHQ